MSSRPGQQGGLLEGWARRALRCTGVALRRARSGSRGQEDPLSRCPHAPTLNANACGMPPMLRAGPRSPRISNAVGTWRMHACTRRTAYEPGNLPWQHTCTHARTHAWRRWCPLTVQQASGRPSQRFAFPNLLPSPTSMHHWLNCECGTHSIPPTCARWACQQHAVVRSPPKHVFTIAGVSAMDTHARTTWLHAGSLNSAQPPPAHLCLWPCGAQQRMHEPETARAWARVTKAPNDG